MILGQDIRVFVNSDSTNKTVNSKAFILVEQLNAFPVLAFKTATTNLETFDSEWNSKLCEEISTDDIKISVNTVLDDESEAVMQEAFSDSELMQVKIEVSDEVNTYYYILNGYISNVSNSGDKDKVHISTYTFSPDELVGNGYYVTPDYLVEGDGGVLSNGGTIPTPLGTNQTGNSFIKIDSTESVTGTELLGIVNIDNQDHTALTITKSGSLHAYVENTSDSAELYTTKNKPTSSDVGTYSSTEIDTKLAAITPDSLDVYTTEQVDSFTVNGYSISKSPVLNSSDIGTYDSDTIDTKLSTINGTINSLQINGKDVVDDPVLTFSDVKAVQDTATINGYKVNTNPVLVAGDVNAYTKEEVNQIIAGETTIGVTSINGEMGDVVLDYDDVNAVSDLCTINGKLLSSNAVLTFSDVNAASDACTVNGKLLSSNPVLTASDVSALSLSGGQVNGGISVVKDNAPIVMYNKTKGEALYLKGSNPDATGRWYVGNGGADSDDAAFGNYISGNHLLLVADGSIQINAGGTNKALSVTGDTTLHNFLKVEGSCWLENQNYINTGNDRGSNPGHGMWNSLDSSGILGCAYGYYGDAWQIHFYDTAGAWKSNPISIASDGQVTCNASLLTSHIQVNAMDSTVSLVIGDSDTGFGNGGDGVLLMFANAAKVANIQSNGATFYTPIYSTGVYDNNQRVYSPINPPPASSTTTSALGTNGWWKDNSTGMITQWGYCPQVGSSTVTVAFPIAFPTTCASVLATKVSAGSEHDMTVNSVTSTTFGIYTNDGYSPGYWIAIGY